MNNFCSLILFDLNRKQCLAMTLTERYADRWTKSVRQKADLNNTFLSIILRTRAPPFMKDRPTDQPTARPTDWLEVSKESYTANKENWN